MTKIKICVTKGTAKFLLILFALIGISFSLLLMSPIQSADSSQQVTTANATIQVNVAIGLSGNLSTGIVFINGTNPNDVILIKGGNDYNASYNFNGTNNPTFNNETLYWVTIESTTNVPIDVCTRTNANLTTSDGQYFIPNLGLTWNATRNINNGTHPPYPPTVWFTEDFTWDTNNLVTNNTQTGILYLRFALDIPSNQQAGTYNNTVYFCGKDSSYTCTC
jgi:hypothetical protein